MLGRSYPVSVVSMRSHVYVVSLLHPSDLKSRAINSEFLFWVFLNGRKRLKLCGEEFLAVCARSLHICSVLFVAAAAERG